MLTRRKVLYEAIHPETRHGASGGGRDGKGTRLKTQDAESATSVPAFADDTAAATGRSARVIREELQIGKLSEAERESRVDEVAQGAGVEVTKLFGEREVTSPGNFDRDSAAEAVESLASGAVTADDEMDLRKRV